jgi:FKBP-type peptidyl-prolyl cis-trans isomerase
MKHKNLFYILLITIVAAFSFSACNDDNTADSQWRIDNQKAYDDVKADSKWLPVNTTDVGGPTGVYYQDISDPGVVKGTEHPIATASVKIDYTGTNYLGTIFDSGVGATFNVNGVVVGFGAALQKMVVGDNWKICIPYYLGYGTTYVNANIQAYSTLFFDIELLEIDQHPQ